MQLLLSNGVNTTDHDYSDLLGQAIVDENTRIRDLLRRYGVNDPSHERLEELQQEHDRWLLREEYEFTES